MKSKVLGIHHVTAISGAAHENYKFYTQVLGQRLVKKTVNFDDPGTYHLYYGDRTGSPGTLMTFFPYGGPQARKGHGQVAVSAYPVKDLEEWRRRLLAAGVEVTESRRFGHTYLGFEDPHGMSLELFGSENGEEAPYRIGGATLKVQRLGPEQKLLEFLGFEREAEEQGRHRYRASTTGDYLEVVESDEPAATGGAGSVHHIALRVPDDAAQLEWLQALRKAGYQVSPVMDRNYFHSIYFRSPNGILFELATDPPGMLIDEPEETLGTHLMLPEQYEKYRERLEAVLDPLEEPYRTVQVEGQGPTIVALHGTGGNEYDLLDLVRQVAPENPVLGIRGNVSEGGMTRYFRRLKAGVFDQQDLAKRSADLAEYVKHKAPDAVALGYSNGANIAAATLMSDPDSFRRLVLLRPMLGWEPPKDVDLSGRSVLLLIGRRDTVVSPDSGRALAKAFQDLGAEVKLVELEADHGLTPQDLDEARRWLAQQWAAQAA